MASTLVVSYLVPMWLSSHGDGHNSGKPDFRLSTPAPWSLSHGLRPHGRGLDDSSPIGVRFLPTLRPSHTVAVVQSKDVILRETTEGDRPVSSPLRCLARSWIVPAQGLSPIPRTPRADIARRRYASVHVSP